MAKFKLFVDEIRSFRHEIEIETELNENELDKKLTEIEDKNKTTDIGCMICALIEEGISFTKSKIDEEGSIGELKIEEMEEVE